MVFRPGVSGNPKGRPRIHPVRAPRGRWGRSPLTLVENNLRIRASAALAASGGGPPQPAATFLVADARGRLTLFECQRCHRHCRDLFLPALACRYCLGLDHSARHGQARRYPAIWRISTLRRRLAKFKPSNANFYRIAAKIEALQAALRYRRVRRVWKRGGTYTGRGGRTVHGRWVKSGEVRLYDATAQPSDNPSHAGVARAL